jgi:hypothetical protein
MHAKIKFIFSLVILGVLVSSCFKSEVYPVEPIIYDPVFLISGDSAQLTFSFTDGDGDIGLAPGDTLAPYEPDSYFHYNLHIDYYEKDDVDGWQRGRDLDGDSIIFQYRLKPIVVKGKARGIKGTMEVLMRDFANPFSDQSDTIKFTIRLIDKALNESDVIETSEIYL